MTKFLKFKNNLLFSLVLIVLFTIIYVSSSFSAVTIKGGVISSAEVLRTEKPKPRNDLIFDLNNFDKTHLNQKLTIEEAIRFGASSVRIGSLFFGTRVS